MTTKHTPGPWSEPKPYGNDRYEIAKDRRIAIVDKIEDARLIAAAPELADLLGQILRADESGNNGAYMGEAILCPYFAKAAKYILAKLEGGK